MEEAKKERRVLTAWVSVVFAAAFFFAAEFAVVPLLAEVGVVLAFEVGLAFDLGVVLLFFGCAQGNQIPTSTSEHTENKCAYFELIFLILLIARITLRLLSFPLQRKREKVTSTDLHVGQNEAVNI